MEVIRAVLTILHAWLHPNVDECALDAGASEDPTSRNRDVCNPVVSSSILNSK